MYVLSIRLRPWVLSAKKKMARIKFVVRTLFGCSLLSSPSTWLMILVDNCGLAVVHVDAPGVDHDFDSDSEGRL